MNKKMKKYITSNIIVMLMCANNVYAQSNLSNWATSSYDSLKSKNLLPKNFTTNLDYTDSIYKGEFIDLVINYYKHIKNYNTSKTNKSLAYELGIVKGDSSNNINTNEKLTREQASTIIIRCEELIRDIDKTSSIEFMDYEEISGWALEGVSTVSKEGIITGFEDNTFRPKDDLSKEQAIVVINRLLDINEKDTISDSSNEEKVVDVSKWISEDDIQNEFKDETKDEIKDNSSQIADVSKWIDSKEEVNNTTVNKDDNKKEEEEIKDKKEEDSDDIKKKNEERENRKKLDKEIIAKAKQGMSIKKEEDLDYKNRQDIKISVNKGEEIDLNVELKKCKITKLFIEEVKQGSTYTIKASLEVDGDIDASFYILDSHGCGYKLEGDVDGFYKSGLDCSLKDIKSIQLFDDYTNNAYVELSFKN